MYSALIPFAFPLASTFDSHVLGIDLCLENSNTSYCLPYMTIDDKIEIEYLANLCVERFVTSPSHLMIWLYGDMVTEEVTTSKPVAMVTTATGMGTTAADGNAKERDQGNPNTILRLLTLSKSFQL